MNKFKYSVGHKGVLHKFEGRNKHEVFEKAKDFLKKSNINFSPEDLMKAIERQSGYFVPDKKIGFNEAMTGAMAALKFTTGKSTSAKEIQRRSAICAACPLATSVGGCFSCGVGGKIAKIVTAIRSKKGSDIAIPSEIKNQYCGFCKCALPLMVVTKLEDFYPEAPELNARRPDYCWLKTTSINFSDE